MARKILSVLLALVAAMYAVVGVIQLTVAHYPPGALHVAVIGAVVGFIAYKSWPRPKPQN
jgi:hypothetical protein